MYSASKKVKRLWKRQEGKCYFCSCETHLRKKEQKRMKHNTATVEHLIPKSEGGSSRIINLKMSCNKCNIHRGVMNAIEWFLIASNPKILEKYYADKWTKKLVMNKHRRNKRKEQLLEKYGIYYHFSNISRLEFNDLFKGIIDD